MKNSITPRDYEVLSAYLDGQLDPRQKANLEARLKTNQDLADTLRKLTQTRAMLRSLPVIKAPRSFKLTPEMSGKRPTPRLYPIFQFASALASVLLVLVLAGDFLGLRIGSRSAAPVPAAAPLIAAQPTQAAGVQAFSAKSASSNPALEGTPAAPATRQDQTQSSPGLGVGSAASTAYPPRAAILGATQLPSPESTKSPAISMASPELNTAPLLAATPTPGAVVQALPTLSPTEAQPPQVTGQAETHGQPSSIPPIRIGEIALALVAMGTGLAAYLLRRGMGR